jgi:predicted dithiol-disulfide oxidoreductase (DUF899 family)
MVYSFMYPEGGNPCPACTSLIDDIDGLTPNVADRVNFAVYAKTPVAVFRDWARARRLAERPPPVDQRHRLQQRLRDRTRW